MKLIFRCIVEGSQVHEYLELTDADITYFDVTKFKDLHDEIVKFLCGKYHILKIFLLDIRFVSDATLCWPDNLKRIKIKPNVLS